MDYKETKAALSTITYIKEDIEEPNGENQEGE